MVSEPGALPAAPAPGLAGAAAATGRRRQTTYWWNR
jgi:hypothetical protein